MNWRLILVLPLLWACTDQEKSQNDYNKRDKTTEEVVADPAHKSQNSLNWAGTYKGILPCEDCEGVETRITLKEDGKYSREEKYLGKSNTPLMGAGVYEWNEAGSKVTLKSPSGNDKTYKVVENGLIFYKGGEEPADSEKFRLEKNLTDPDLEDKKWVLTELYGKNLSENSSEETPYLEFNSMGARMSGNASCNDFFGRYELLSKNRISMGEKMSLTRKNCEGNSLEERFVDVLKSANAYKISGENLIFMSKGKELAKLELSQASV